MPRDLSGTSIGDYELLELVGRGSMAQVFRVRQKETGEIRALKLLLGPAVFDETALARIRREAEVIRTIEHPSIVRLIDHGISSADLRPYLVLEWVHGKLLSDAIVQEGPFDPERAASITRQIAAGLHAIHALGFVHRDLKPQNVILTGGKLQKVKIVDFGLVAGDTALWERLTKTGEIVGTPLYMSPESIEGRPVDARTDLYSLGVMAYEMLAGRVPFASPGIPEILAAHLDERAPALPRMGGMERIVAAMMEKDPARRPADALALIMAIDELDPSGTGDVVPLGIPVVNRVAEARTVVAPPAAEETAAIERGAEVRTTVAAPEAGVGAAIERGAAPPEASHTAEGPMTMPPVQAWSGGGGGSGGRGPGRKDSVSETVRIPLGRSDTELEEASESGGVEVFAASTRSERVPSGPDSEDAEEADEGLVRVHDSRVRDERAGGEDERGSEESDADATVQLEEPTHAIEIPVTNPYPASERTDSYPRMAMDLTPPPAPRPSHSPSPSPAPAPVAASSAAGARGLPAHLASPLPRAPQLSPSPLSPKEKRKIVMRVLFFILGAALTTLALYYARNRRVEDPPIAIPPIPRAVDRGTHTSTRGVP